ncbi:MAG: LysM peptidoglycan-binding domain-containing protein [Planctomycetales bacterium]
MAHETKVGLIVIAVFMVGLGAAITYRVFRIDRSAPGSTSQHNVFASQEPGPDPIASNRLQDRGSEWNRDSERNRGPEQRLGSQQQPANPSGGSSLPTPTKPDQQVEPPAKKNRAQRAFAADASLSNDLPVPDSSVGSPVPSPPVEIVLGQPVVQQAVDLERGEKIDGLPHEQQGGRHAEPNSTVSSNRLPPTVPPVVPDDPGRVHVVQPNDSFWSIAKSQYGYGGYFNALIAHNRQVRPLPARLSIGDQIFIPSEKFLLDHYPELCPH